MFIIERTQLIFACRMQWHQSLHICAYESMVPCSLFSILHSCPGTARLWHMIHTVFTGNVCCASSLSPPHAPENKTVVMFKSILVPQTVPGLDLTIFKNSAKLGFRSLGLAYNCYSIVYHLLSSSEANKNISNFRWYHQNILCSSLCSVRLNTKLHSTNNYLII